MYSALARLNGAADDLEKEMVRACERL